VAVAEPELVAAEPELVAAEPECEWQSPVPMVQSNAILILVSRVKWHCHDEASNICQALLIVDGGEAGDAQGGPCRTEGRSSPRHHRIAYRCKPRHMRHPPQVYRCLPSHPPRVDTGALRFIHRVMYRCSPRHPPHVYRCLPRHPSQNVPVLATTGTSKHCPPCHRHTL